MIGKVFGAMWYQTLGNKKTLQLVSTKVAYMFPSTFFLICFSADNACFDTNRISA